MKYQKSNKTEYKYKIDKSFIDFNGHLAEFGYYYYGVEGLRKLCEDRGCTPELYEELKIDDWYQWQYSESYRVLPSWRMP